MSKTEKKPKKLQKKPQKNSRARAFNNTERALKLLKVLWEKTDDTHRLSQTDLLKKMEKIGAGCTEKTLRNDLRNLREVLNSKDDDDYSEETTPPVICYDGMENDSARMTEIYYRHPFSDADIQILIRLVLESDYLNDADKLRLEKTLKDQGSEAYSYGVETIRTIAKRTIHYKDNLRENIARIQEAIAKNVRLSFVFNHYNRDGELEALREKRYEANPYYICIYGQRYYMLATHEQHTDIHIYRIDLMSNLELLDKKRESEIEIPELNTGNAAYKYMDRHINANFGDPATVHLKVRTDLGYNAIHDQFGDMCEFKKKIDDDHDLVEVKASIEAIVQFLFPYLDRIEVIRPKAARELFLEKAQKITDIYTRAAKA